MRMNAVYLEAADRTQDLLNIKWTLRSAGYTIISKWHDEKTACFNFKSHWSTEAFDRLRMCDMLVILGGASCDAAVQIGLMAGFAFASGVEVYWLGNMGKLNQLPGVEVFNTVDEFRTHILKCASEQITVPEQLAA